MASENLDVVIEYELAEASKVEKDGGKGNFVDYDSESKIISLISQLTEYDEDNDESESDSETLPSRMQVSKWESKIISLVIQIFSLVRSTDFESQPKPKSKFMSLVTQTISFFSSMDSDSLPKPLSKLISLISDKVSKGLDQSLEFELKFKSLACQTLQLKPNSELILLMRQIVSFVVSTKPKSKKIICLQPKVQVDFSEGKFHVIGEVTCEGFGTWLCFLGKWKEFKLKREDEFYFRCERCNGEYHKEYEKASLEINHPLHQKHCLELVLMGVGLDTRECYCCDENLMKVFYYCSACDFAMNIACVEKTPLLAKFHPKWHEHTLALFPRQTLLTCNVCALADSSSAFYMCPPCDFVAHQRCFSLPRVIRISRHSHRVSFTLSFNQDDLSCGVCRRKIDNDFGGYSCIRDNCFYALHSRCATQSNVWDGIDLEGVPEEIEEEEIEPFVRISDGIIQHFLHEHHHLRLEEDTCKDYDENKMCQACITPIYFGNFYSCVHCQFVLHETCAYLSRAIYHPIHPHKLKLALMGGIDDVIDIWKDKCSACHRFLKTGFFYKCGKEECDFQLHVQCAAISEPFVHESHMHPLFLTSKPGVGRSCRVCGEFYYGSETLNCIECEDFALCFQCATLPSKVRYKHDKHILTLVYGEETSTMTYWCEVCEKKINPKGRFYTCDEYCCVTLHIECLIGSDLYIKHGSTSFFHGEEVDVLANNHHMTRPICSTCEKRCLYKIVFQCDESIYCSLKCFLGFLVSNIF